jgi:nucleolar complex protein 2
VSNTRVFPFHLHILRSLLHLTRHTLVYVPLASYILPIVTAVLAPSAQGKTSTLRPLDLDVVIRGPQQYLKTRIYCEVLVEEAAYVLAEWLSGPTVQGSIALPEVVVGVVVVLRKALKTAKVAGTGGKVAGAIKALVEKVEESARWVEGKRQGVQFAPGKFEAVQDWEAAMRGRLGESPLGKHVKILRVTRERRKALVEKVSVMIACLHPFPSLPFSPCPLFCLIYVPHTLMPTG